jgi:hypothetical protein
VVAQLGAVLDGDIYWWGYGGRTVGDIAGGGNFSRWWESKGVK